MNKAHVLIAAALLVALPLGGALQAADTARELKWADLMPPLDPKPSPLKPKAFFSGSTPQADAAPTVGPGADDAPPPPPMHGVEGKFMSMKRYQPGADRPPRVVPALNNTRIKIGGYVVPLDFEKTTVKEFLLVPFVGACIHVPPPPTNQIVYVKSEKGFEIADTFEPVTVTGTIKTETAFTGIADAGYSIDADAIEKRTE